MTGFVCNMFVGVRIGIVRFPDQLIQISKGGNLTKIDALCSATALAKPVQPRLWKQQPTAPYESIRVSK